MTDSDYGVQCSPKGDTGVSEGNKFAPSDFSQLCNNAARKLLMSALDAQQI